MADTVEMKTLTIDGTTFEVVDETARRINTENENKTAADAAAAQASAEAAEAAKDAAETAQGAAEKAKSDAESAKSLAVSAKNTATSAASQAEQAASRVSSTVNEAASYASNASKSATAAKTSENNAASSASSASSSKTAAATSASNASASASSAETAKTAAETAQGKAESAQTAAETAKSGAESAKAAAATSETNAANSAGLAASAAGAAQDAQYLAEKYANEAKGWAENAEQAAGGSSGGSSGDASIPSFVKEEADRVAKVALLKQSANTFTFLAMSDAHYLESDTEHENYIPTALKHAAQGMEYIRRLVPVDLCVNCGDNSWGTDTDLTVLRNEIIRVNDIFADAFAGVPNFRTPGNHDAQTYTVESRNGEYIEADEIFGMYGKFNSGAIYPNGERDRGYCYLDFEDYKIRAICLNTCDTKGRTFSEDKSSEYISGTQMQWLAETMDLSAKEDAAEWGIMFFSHHPMDWCFIMPSTAILRAYETGGVVSFTHTDGVAVSYDFSGKNAAHLIAQFHGHLHNFKVDNIHYLDNGVAKTLNVQRMCIPNACYLRDDEYADNGKKEEYGIEFGQAAEYPYEKIGYAETKNETAFNLVTIDTKNKKVYATVFGNGTDREIQYTAGGVEEEEPTIINQIEISTDTDGSVYNGTGYKTATRISSSSGTVSTSGTGVADFESTGFIPIDSGDTVYLKNVQLGNFGANSNYNGIGLYKEDKSFIAYMAYSDLSSYCAAVTDDSGSITQFSCTHSNFTLAKFIRFSAYGIDDTSIITVNQPIV